MDNEQFLLWWQGLHPFNVTLYWVATAINIGFLVLLYWRLRAGFLIVWLFANGVELIANLFNVAYPQAPDRPHAIGALIEILRALHHIIGLTGAYMCVRWFWKTRSPNR